MHCCPLFLFPLKTVRGRVGTGKVDLFITRGGVGTGEGGLEHDPGFSFIYNSYPSMPFHTTLL